MQVSILFGFCLVLSLAACGGSGAERVDSEGTEAVADNCAQTLSIQSVTVPTRLENLAIGCDYRVNTDIEVRAMLTIDPGVEIQFADQAGLRIISGGLELAGLVSDQVLLREAADSLSAWNGIWVIRADQPVLLKHMTLRNAGAESPVQSVDAAVDVANAELSLIDVKVQGSETHGILLRPGVQLRSFSGNQIHGSKLAPLIIESDPAAPINTRLN